MILKLTQSMFPQVLQCPAGINRQELCDADLPGPPRHNSCRFNRTKNLGGGDEGLQWHDTDKHSRTER